MSRILVNPHRVDKSRIDDNSSNEYPPNALKFRGYKTDKNTSKSFDFTFSMEIMGSDEASCVGSRERRVLNTFESRQKK